MEVVKSSALITEVSTVQTIEPYISSCGVKLLEYYIAISYEESNSGYKLRPEEALVVPSLVLCHTVIVFYSYGT